VREWAAVETEEGRRLTQMSPKRASEEPPRGGVRSLSPECGSGGFSRHRDVARLRLAQPPLGVCGRCSHRRMRTGADAAGRLSAGETGLQGILRIGFPIGPAEMRQPEHLTQR